MFVVIKKTDLLSQVSLRSTKKPAFSASDLQPWKDKMLLRFVQDLSFLHAVVCVGFRYASLQLLELQKLDALVCNGINLPALLVILAS